METLSELLAVCVGNPVDSPHKKAVMQSFDALFALSLNKLMNERWIVVGFRRYHVPVT